jgi:hypothetical protein
VKEEVQYKWRIKWCGRWTTSHFCTEDAIRIEHPEAVRIDASRRVITIPSTEEEMKAGMYAPRGGR